MNDNPSIGILESNLRASAGAADRLAYSIGRVRQLGLASLTLQRLSTLTDTDMEVMDAFIYRYGSLVANIQDAIFKSIGEAEQEPMTTMSNRDKTNLMERIGALPSAEAFSSIAYIRNKLMHDYPEEAKKQLDRMNFISAESPQLVSIFLGITRYAEKFGIHFRVDDFTHLSQFAGNRAIGSR
ncbi:MAG: hypothetical protein ABI478_04800 [Propionivibrio sp.]